ncbi:unnamed protein product [Cuscuta epithymum]|uniref:Aminotransferase-like plant mobile domain-containing protein n=1 Tax=Cuscuta epithymum TaxID=186058 RepID=A0AAV0FPP3_9ASTE|nr:unnamed protein product [Cuscuta epithymum]
MAERVAQPGPQDRSVLFMLPDEHRADRVWHESSFRDVKLKCQHYSREAYVEEGPRHPGVVQLLRVSGFHGVERIGQLQLDWSLVTALVERWRPEVHAFHLPFGEVGLTLQDVQVLLGLPVDGIPLTGPTITEKAALLQMCADSVGFIPIDEDLNSPTIKVPNIHRIRLTEWSTENEVTQHTRALIWQLLGGSLFPTTSANMVRYSRTSRAEPRQETRFPNEMDMRPRRREQHD